MSEEAKKEDEKITVAGVTFKASEVMSAVIKIDGRKIHITEKEEEQKTIGFKIQ